MAYDSNHAKLWQDIKADLDKTTTRASKFAANAEWAFGKKTARVLGVLALFAAAVIFLFVLLNLYVAPTKPSEKKDLVLAVAQILAGTALLSGIYFTWRGQRITQKAQEDNQRTTQEQLKNAQEQLNLTRQSQAQTQENTQRTLKLTEQGQITERFTRAIDQLGATDDDGNPRLEIRLGGIYALERIDKESPERAYHETVMEVLTAYVRENSRWVPEEASPQMSAAKAAAKQEWGTFRYAKLDREVGKQTARTLRRLMRN